MSLAPRIKPKTQRSKRALEARAPKLVEAPKAPLILRGTKCSATVQTLLKDFHILLSPLSQHFHKHHDMHPFEDAQSLEFLCAKNDKPLFMFGSSNKKRPNNVILGRMFDGVTLDMVELGVNADTFQSLATFESQRKSIIRHNSKPAIIFQGERFETHEDYRLLQSLFLDYFRGEVMEKVNLSALDRVIIITAIDDTTLTFRHYAVAMKRSSDHGMKPRIELDEAGPRVDFTFRRRKQATEDVVKASMVRAKDPRKTKEKKNLEINAMGDRVGRIHMKRQDLANVAIAKLKGLKRKRDGGDDTESMTGEEGASASVMDAETVESTPRRRGVSGAGGYGPNRSHVAPLASIKKRKA